MKKVLSNNIAATQAQPYIQKTHEWYTAMTQEATESLARCVVKDNSDFTILYGCENTGILPAVTISAGAVFYNGEMYLCPAFSTLTIVDTIVGTITTSYSSVDPILFTDNNSYNVHQVKTIVWSDSTSGSGDVDFLDLVNAIPKGLSDDYTTGTIPLVDWGHGGVFTISAADQTAPYGYWWKKLNNNTVTFNFYYKLTVANWHFLLNTDTLGFSLPDGLTYPYSTGHRPNGTCVVTDNTGVTVALMAFDNGSNATNINMFPTGAITVFNASATTGTTYSGDIYMRGEVTFEVNP